MKAKRAAPWFVTLARALAYCILFLMTNQVRKHLAGIGKPVAIGIGALMFVTWWVIWNTEDRW